MAVIGEAPLPVPDEEHHWDILGSTELESDQREQLYQFREAINDLYAVWGVQALDVADYEKSAEEESARARSDHIQQGILRDTAAKGQRFWVSPEYEWLERSAFNEFHVLRAARAETSAHQVFFGLLHDGDPDRRSLPVAVKPCVKRPEKACSDWVNNSLVKRDGLRGFEPVGFMMHDGKGYSITRLDVSADTLENTPWSAVFRDEQDERFAHQRETLSEIAIKLARLHEKGIFHGDPQFKNVALDVTGEVFFIDWESSTVFEERELSEDRRFERASKDLRILFASMTRTEEQEGVGLLSHLTPRTRWDFFKKYIFNPYMEKTLEKSEDARFEMLGELEEHIRDYIIDDRLSAQMARERHN